MTERRLLVLFVTTGLLGCAAPVSDSTGDPAGDESIDPAEDFGGKADQAGSQIELLPIRRVDDAPNSLDYIGQFFTRDVRIDWERGWMKIKFPLDCLERDSNPPNPIELVTTGPARGDTAIFVTRVLRCSARTLRSRTVYFDLRPLLYEGVTAIKLHEDAEAITRHEDIEPVPRQDRWTVPGSVRNFWRSLWTRPLSCSSEQDGRFLLKSYEDGSPALSRVDEVGWSWDFEVVDVSKRDFDGVLLTSLDGETSVSLRRDIYGNISGSIVWREHHVDAVRCSLLR